MHSESFHVTGIQLEEPLAVGSWSLPCARHRRRGRVGRVGREALLCVCCSGEAGRLLPMPEQT